MKDAVILAGGMGTRLAPVIGGIPKVMAPVSGRPFLTYVLDQLRRQEIRHVCLAVGYQAEMIRDYFKDGSSFGMKLSYSCEERPLGTGGAIKKAAAQLAEEFLVLNGDSYLEIDFHELIRFHRDRGAVLTMAVTESEEADRYGRVLLDEGSKIMGFREKEGRDRYGIINAGIYMINEHFLKAIPEDTHVSFERDVLPRGIHAGLYGLKVKSFFVDIGTPSSYAQIKDGFPKGG